jgi:hypothetical protein
VEKKTEEKRSITREVGRLALGATETPRRKKTQGTTAMA